ncbi:MAG: Nif3-like dinuclear metal center hexameric protein [Muribaculaceae bacterium]|nr:Nif3-like dinuclear metal center hexameric protein [Muribaculaceae bacterium]
MRLSYVIAAIEEFAPRALQESWDNSGLQIGLPPGSDECTGVLLCVDVTEAIIAEAVEAGCNLVLSHHPLIFKGLKSLSGRTPSERAAAAAIRAGVAVYSAHTSLDSTRGGVSYAMAERLGARVLHVLEPTSMTKERITVLCPRADAADVRLLLLDADIAGATAWHVDRDSLDTTERDGIPESIIAHTPLTRVELTVPSMQRREIVRRLEGSGSRLTVQVQPLADHPDEYGLGVVAEFDKPVEMGKLPAMLREAFGTPAIRASQAALDSSRPVRRIALCGGAGGEFIAAAEAAGAAAYVSADIRYHDFADRRDGIAVFDIGHFESENCAKDIFYRVLCEKFPNFAVQKSKLENNPVIYL